MRKRKIIYLLAVGCVFGIYSSMKPQDRQVSVVELNKEDNTEE